jgi:SAM-dependent methyltransferase
VQFDPDAFRGTAEFYAVGRPPYSAQLAATLARELALDGTGALLDVGCGPGVLELELAGLFDEVVAVDPEPEMLAEGRRRCAAAGVAAVTWVQGAAEDLAGLGIRPPRVVAFAQSFHRVRRREVADAVYELLEPGGALVLISHRVEGRPRPVDPGFPPIPHAAVRELIIEFRGPQARDYFETWSGERQPERFEDTLRESRFGGSRTVCAPGRPDLIRDIDTVVANYLSMSYAAPRMFGDRFAAFEDALRGLLRDSSPSGLFWDWPGDTELVIASRS